MTSFTSPAWNAAGRPVSTERICHKTRPSEPSSYSPGAAWNPERACQLVRKRLRKAEHILYQQPGNQRGRDGHVRTGLSRFHPGSGKILAGGSACPKTPLPGDKVQHRNRLAAEYPLFQGNPAVYRGDKCLLGII